MGKIIYDYKDGFDSLRVHQFTNDSAGKDEFYFEVYGDPSLSPEQATELATILSTAAFEHLPTNRAKPAAVPQGDPGDACECRSCAAGPDVV